MFLSSETLQEVHILTIFIKNLISFYKKGIFAFDALNLIQIMMGYAMHKMFALALMITWTMTMMESPMDVINLSLKLNALIQSSLF